MASYCNYTGPFFPGFSVNLNREGPGILQSELLKTRQRVDNRSDENWENIFAFKTKKGSKKTILIGFLLQYSETFIKRTPSGNAVVSA